MFESMVTWLVEMIGTLGYTITQEETHNET